MKTLPANSHRAYPSRGFALVVTLVIVTLLAIIAIGLLTSTSMERATAKSYTDRYQAELAVQNGLEAFKQTLVASPNATSPTTGTDTFLVVRTDSGSAAYYYLAQPSTGSSPTITYYPLFSASSTPTPTPSPLSIKLTAQDQPNPQDLTKPFAPLVPAPVPPPDSTPPPLPSPNSSPTPSDSAWNAARTQRLPTLYSWQQPSPSPSGPSVKWVETHDLQDPSGPYTRYAYWAEDLDGYLDASQAGGQPRASGTSPQEIAMWTVFNSTPQTDPNNTAATFFTTNRSLLFTVPTIQQYAQQVAPTTAAAVGPNLAVRLGLDNNPGEQNLVPLGYGYGSEGASKTNLNPLSQLRGNIPAKFATPLGAALPALQNRTTQTANAGVGHNSSVVNYLNNLAANIVDYASPQNAPTDFMPPGNPTAPPAARGIGAYPFVTSLYDLNNWVFTYGSNSTFTYHVVVEVKTYVQLWNPHNVPVTGAVIVHYQNSDQVNLVDPATGINKTFPLTSPPDATIIFTNNPNPNPNKPVITSPLAEIGNVGVPFNYQITATNGPNQYPALQPNAYRVVVLPAPGSAPLSISHYGATGLPPGLSFQGGGANAGQISGTPTTSGTYNVTISATNSSGTASATLVITIN